VSHLGTADRVGEPIEALKTNVGIDQFELDGPQHDCRQVDD
jgi:hypothetical protein